MGIQFRTDNAQLQARHEAALAGLRANLVRVHRYEAPVLIEGGMYPGIWLECGPLEGAVYAMVDPQVAVDNHRVFFQLQREDGYFPCYVWRESLGTGQIQMVVPIAATAYELYRQFGDRDFLAEAYAACARWDDWLARYRDTHGTGLCEAFCEYDTGHDRSPRWRGVPRECPDRDARRCPDVPGLPYLSATVYGGRVALAAMAYTLGMEEDALRWREKAEQTRQALLAYCFDAETLCFYDLNRDGRFVRIRGDVISRVLSEHVVDRRLFGAIYRRHILNPEAFWTPYPLPSIAANDPAFDHDLPANSWGGATQALTALRAPRWFEYYDKRADLGHLMRRWVQALVQAPEFMQQMNPWTGEFSTSAGYSPSMLVLLEFVSRLHGVRREADTLAWNCGCLPEGGTYTDYALTIPGGEARLCQRGGEAILSLNGQEIARVVGPCRVVTDLEGKPRRVLAVAQEPAAVSLAGIGGAGLRVTLSPDTQVEM